MIDNNTNNEKQAQGIAQTILDGFNRHYRIYTEYNSRAAYYFHQAKWLEGKRCARDQVDLYDQRVRECVNTLRCDQNITAIDTELWLNVKRCYVALLYQHLQPELAESYFNSVYCKLFNRRYYQSRFLFYKHAVNTVDIECEQPDYRAYYPHQYGLEHEIHRILEEAPIELPFIDKLNDVAHIKKVIESALTRDVASNYLQIHILTPVFYRNKGAYLVGRIIDNTSVIPLVIPILQNEKQQCYADTALTNRNEVSHVFSFTRAYFKADFPVPSTLVHFMQGILPGKSLADLYTSIGFHKQGKNEFYRAFVYHLRHSSDDFIIAPGTEGMVMMVFTLPSYPYVFKIIKDRFHPNKDVTHDQVKERYHLIKQLDRVGRMADTLKFSYVSLPLERFPPELLCKLKESCADNLLFEREQLIIKHVYLERRMIPLNLYLNELSDEDSARVVRDYAKAIEEIATAGIFPGDLLLKNFGVTRNERVVFYDYDEIIPIEECNFRNIPPPRTPEQELSNEPWYHVGKNDVFPQEFKHFLVNNAQLRSIFEKEFPHLMTVAYWRDVQQQIKQGRLLDVYPYNIKQRFYPER